MPSIFAVAAKADLTVDGTANGIITIANTSPFYPGADAFLTNNDPVSQRVLILKIVSLTQMVVRLLPDNIMRDAQDNITRQQVNLGPGDCTAFTVAKQSKIFMNGQVVAIDPAFSKHNLI